MNYFEGIIDLEQAKQRYRELGKHLTRAKVEQTSSSKKCKRNIGYC
jgi:hypothetical protein